MIGKPSAKYKYLTGEPTYVKTQYQDLVTPLQGIEGNQICANSKYVIIPWKGGGGSFTVKSHEEQGRVSMNTPLYKGHSGALQDMEFSPFHENLLATASGDASLRLWAMPEGTLTESTDQAQAVLKGHSKKVMLMQWHPSAEFTIASCSQGGGVRIWDVQLERTQYNYAENKAVPWSLSWNYDGSLVNILTKDKQMHVIDPRQEKAVTVVPAHQGAKAQRVQWKGKHGLCITVGTSDFNDREYMVFDQRDWTKPLQQTQLDSNTQVVWTYYDDITNLFFVTNKGSTFTQMFYFSETGEKSQKPELIPLGTYNDKVGTHYFYFMPKHAVDPLRKEVLRGLRFTGKTAEFISFRLPRKEEEFSADLFPPHRAQKAAMTYEEWSKGENKDPVLESFDPDQLQSQLQEKVEKFVFTKKPGAGPPIERDMVRRMSTKMGMVNASEISQIAESGIDGYDNSEEVAKLKDELQQKQNIINKNEQTIKDLESKLNMAQSNAVQNSAQAVENGPVEKLDKPELGYFNIRGQAMAIRYLLTYAGIDYDEKFYNEEDLAGSLPQMPYLKDKNGTTVGETLTILKHLATTYKPDLLGNSVENDTCLSNIGPLCVDLHTFCTQYCYGLHQDQNFEDVLYEKVNPILSLLKGDHILGDQACYLDFYLYEIVQLLDFLTNGKVFTDYEQLSKLYSNMNTTMQNTDQYNQLTQQLEQFPFVHRFAKWNNWPKVNWKQFTQSDIGY